VTSVRGVAAGLALGVAIAFVVACANRSQVTPDWQRRQAKLNEVTTLWAQIRQFRREAGMEVEPSPASTLEWRDRSVKEAARVCPDGHTVPKTCDEICSLADAICDNAEAICGIADELGKDDQMAQEKCTSAKASCREAKQRCCNCSGDPAP
jgi:hypothetical protein